MGRLAAIALCFVLGCSTPVAGREFDPTHVKDLRKQAQDKRQIREWFGAPRETQVLTDDYYGCVERWRWYYAWNSSSGRHSRSLWVDFDSRGRVCGFHHVET